MTRDEFDAFVARLWAHDWTYQMSDDNSVYTKGRDESRKLQNLAHSDAQGRLTAAYFTVSKTINYPGLGQRLTVEAAKAKIEEIRNQF